MAIPRFIASSLVLLILWTGTLLHDLAEMTECSGSTVKQMTDKTRVASTSNSAQREMLCLDSEEHMHDAALALKNSDETILFQTVSKAILAVFTLSHETARDIAKPLQRPPPQLAYGLPTHTFMAKRALLI